MTPQITDTLALFHQPGEVFEVRIPKSRQKTVSGYFNDHDAAARAVAEWDGRCDGVYMTVNPINPALLARAANRLAPYATNTTSDHDVVARRWFLIDLDPRRPAGISSTKEQHKAARERARACRDLLRERGWPEPLVGDSGNGAHLCYRLDLPNTPEVQDLFKRALATLDVLLSDDVVAVDLTPHNAARIWKLYGTAACKGDSTPLHPYRRSRIVKAPPTLDTLTEELLEGLAREDQRPSTGKQRAFIARETFRPFDLDEWIARFALPVASTSAWQGGRKWILSACPWNPDHRDRSAYIAQLPTGAIAAGCHHAGCAGKSWEDLRNAYEPEWRERRARWEIANVNAPSSGGADLATAVRNLALAHEAFGLALRRLSELVENGTTVGAATCAPSTAT